MLFGDRDSGSVADSLNSGSGDGSVRFDCWGLMRVICLRHYSLFTRVLILPELPWPGLEAGSRQRFVSSVAQCFFPDKSPLVGINV